MIKEKFGEKCRMITYEKLWITLKKKGISQYKLIQLGIDKHTLDALRHNRSITMYTLEHLCRVIDCRPNDIVDFIHENKS